jgi:hypothetical protein
MPTNVAAKGKRCLAGRLPARKSCGGSRSKKWTLRGSSEMRFVSDCRPLCVNARPSPF